MEPMPGSVQSYPPPPPPQKSRTGLWIGLAIGAVVLCLCCVLVIGGVYFFRQDIPFVSGLFPSPTPVGLSYTNPAAGVSLTYPLTWQYDESGDASYGYTIIFASSADVLSDSSNAPQTGAAMAILTNVLATSDLSFTVNAGSMGDVVNYIATEYFTNLSEPQSSRNFMLNGSPAASGVYTMTNETGAPSSAYLVAVLRNEEIVMLFGVCPQSEWSQHQPTFDSMINSTVIVTP